MLSKDFDLGIRKFCINYFSFCSAIAKGKRPKKTDLIPDHYWTLINKCWSQNKGDRPSIDSIIDTLKNDIFALEEFGVKTDLKQLHEYQKRLESNNKDEKETKSTNEIEQLQLQIKEFQSFLFYQEEPVYSNFFIDKDIEKFHKIIKKIGEGATSITYKVIDSKNNKTFCKKILKNDQADYTNIKNMMKEFEILKQLNYPSICKAIAINIQEIIKDSNSNEEIKTVAIFLEYLEYKLSDLLKNELLNNTLKVKIVIEIAHAMNYIHKNGLIHRDLKIDNIMLNSVYDAKVVDFGLVRIHEVFNSEYSLVNDSISKGVGTFAYMSPEMLNEENYDYKTDVYSFGVVLYVIFIGNLPKLSLKQKMNGKSFDIPTSGVSKFCADLIKKCMAVNPKDRPSFEEILIEIRKNNYLLINDVDQSIIHHRDNELQLFDKYSK